MKKPFLRIDAALVGALVKLAQLVGLPADTAWEVLKERSFKDTVDADWAKSRKYGVPASCARTGTETRTAVER